MLAVSQNVMPRSSARWKIGAASSSFRIQVIRPAFLSPKLMQPRASRLTTSPDDPSRVYSTMPPVAPLNLRTGALPEPPWSSTDSTQAGGMNHAPPHRPAHGGADPPLHV